MGAQKDVRIVKCSVDTYWYHNEISRVFTVVQDLTRFDHWEVVEQNDGYLHNTRFIEKADAEIVEEPLTGDTIETFSDNPNDDEGDK